MTLSVPRRGRRLPCTAMVDWTLARTVARFAAGSGAAPSLGAFDFAGAAAEADVQLRTYTGLEPTGPLPAPEPVGRAEWAEVNVDSLSRLLDPVTGRLGKRMNGAGPFAPALRTAAGATVAAEVGLVVGYMSQRVLGQYELSLLEPEVQPRLLFVGPNLARTLDELDVDRDSFLGWIVLHELTHVLQFSGVSWLRPHLAGLLRAYLDSVEMRIERGAAGGMPSLPSVSRLVELFREGGLIALVQSPDERRLMDDVQAAMSVVEGYSEHVMDAVGEHV